MLVTGNETNNERVFGSPNDSPYVKDGIERAVVHGEQDKVNPDGTGTKAAMHHVLVVPAEGSATIRLRLTDTRSRAPLRRLRRGDERPARRGRRVLRRRAGRAISATTSGWSAVRRWPACCGRSSTTRLDMEQWLAEHGADPLAPGPGLRNHDWQHLISEDIISMPDKWEYPWFAAWDLAFHAVALAGGRHARSPSSSSSCCSTTATCTRTASCRPTSGTSATSTRRCTRGRPGSCTRWRRPGPGRATGSSSRTRSRS